MDSDPLRRVRRKHTNGWMTALALGLLAAGFLACLYILIGVPAQAQAVGDSTPAPPATAPLYRRQQPPVPAVAVPSGQASVSPSHADIVADELQAELTTVDAQLR